MSEKMKRVLFWTGVIEPHREGISKEVFALHEHLKTSMVIGVSPDGRFACSSGRRFLAIPGKLLCSVRYWSPVAECNFTHSHIYQGMDNYHYLKARGKKPVILTAVAVDSILPMDHYRRVVKVVVECNRDREKVVRSGFRDEDVEVIYPGTRLPCLDSPQLPSHDRFRILFASSPFAPEYMEPRGVRILLEAAGKCRDIEFVLLWRERGETLPLLRKWIAEQSLGNVSVVSGDIHDMTACYRSCHATVIPYTTEKFTKSCPNSAVESLAAGRPVVVSDKVGIAEVVRLEDCGVVAGSDASSLAAAFGEISRNYGRYLKNARTAAEKYFAEPVFLGSYERLYAQVS